MKNKMAAIIAAIGCLFVIGAVLLVFSAVKRHYEEDFARTVEQLPDQKAGGPSGDPSR